MEKLTNLEEMIMKCIWDYGEENPVNYKNKLAHETICRISVYVV